MLGLDSANITAPGEAAGQGIPKGVPCPAVFAFGQIGGEFILNANMAYGFTETELDIAKHTDLPDLLFSLGYTLKRIGSYYTTAEMDSIRIKERLTWRRYSTRQGGDAISFLQEFCGMRFPEAVDYLLAYHRRRRRKVRSAPLRLLFPSDPLRWAPMGALTPPTGTSPSPAPSRLRPGKSRPSSCLPRTRTSGGCLRIFASGELRLR